jgi:hypothetical protein
VFLTPPGGFVGNAEKSGRFQRLFHAIHKPASRTLSG